MHQNQFIQLKVLVSVAAGKLTWIGGSERHIWREEKKPMEQC